MVFDVISGFLKRKKSAEKKQRESRNPEELAIEAVKFLEQGN